MEGGDEGAGGSSTTLREPRRLLLSRSPSLSLSLSLSRSLSLSLWWRLDLCRRCDEVECVSLSVGRDDLAARDDLWMRRLDRPESLSRSRSRSRSLSLSLSRSRSRCLLSLGSLSRSLRSPLLWDREDRFSRGRSSTSTSFSLDGMAVGHTMPVTNGEWCPVTDTERNPPWRWAAHDNASAVAEATRLFPEVGSRLGWWVPVPDVPPRRIPPLCLVLGSTTRTERATRMMQRDTAGSSEFLRSRLVTNTTKTTKPTKTADPPLRIGWRPVKR
ncbi:hypothetical protein VTK73DRAFT_2459 [Phialemonium thermophilum]|uniref:Uncharacterized protein n=1 Tax=Phialemonium thermophilum TaxID=223376 RepID=A0ABR3VS28_9PEZI